MSGSAFECGVEIARAFLATPRGRAFGRRKPRRPFAFSLRNATAALERFAPNLPEELRGLADGLGAPLARAVAESANAQLRRPDMGRSAALSARLYGRNDDFRPQRYDRRLIAIQEPAALRGGPSGRRDAAEGFRRRRAAGRPPFPRS